MKVSVILPFYNAEEYLDNTLRNLVEYQCNKFGQDEWEILLVNDGSTDSSDEKARRWTDFLPNNIKLLTQPNRGVSAARNVALERARGSYIYFIDADDWMLPGALKVLVDVADNMQADLVRFRFESITPDEYTHQCESATRSAPEQPIYSLISVSEFLEQTHAMLEYPSLWSVWSSLFKRSFLISNNLRFVEGLHIGEDKIFMWQTLLAESRLTLIDDCLYLYQVHENNATNNTSVEHLQRRRHAIQKLNDLERELLVKNHAKFSPMVRKYFKIGMGHEIVDLVQYALAFNDSFKHLNGLMRKYHGYMGRFRCSRRLFIDKRFNSTLRSRVLAWLASRVILPYHFIVHRAEYREL